MAGSTPDRHAQRATDDPISSRSRDNNGAHDLDTDPGCEKRQLATSAATVRGGLLADCLHRCDHSLAAQA